MLVPKPIRTLQQQQQQARSNVKPLVSSSYHFEEVQMRRLGENVCRWLDILSWDVALQLKWKRKYHDEAIQLSVMCDLCPKLEKFGVISKSSSDLSMIV